MIDLTGETVAEMKNQMQDAADVMDGVGVMMKSYKKFKKKRTKVISLKQRWARYRKIVLMNAQRKSRGLSG